MSVYGLQAKYWESRRWAVDVPIFCLTVVSVAGRAVILLARDTGQVRHNAMAAVLFGGPG